MMIDHILLYVTDPARSAQFYASLLHRQPVEDSATFALFILDHGLKLGLWKQDGVSPKASMMGGGAELAISLNSDLDVDQIHQTQMQQGSVVLQAPTEMDFGYTCTISDPDGHRIRFLCLHG